MFDLQKKIILAPMAGITEPVFRTLCREHGADIVVSEMVSADGLLHQSKGTEELLRFEDLERPLGVQLFGADPSRMAEATSRVVEMVQPDFVDLNSGCPVRKVVRRNGGAALTKNPELFEKITSAMVSASSVPVTVKIRSGWHTGEYVDTDMARRAEQAGAAAVTLHPRSATQMYSGQADWERIAAVKRTVSIPVIGNGDIVAAGDAVRMLGETGCDAIMIARGSYGNPWLFGQCRAAIEGREPLRVTRRMRLDTAIDHLERFVSMHGESRAIGEMKKHVAWYMKGVVGAPKLRNDVFRATTIKRLRGVLTEALSVDG